MSSSNMSSLRVTPILVELSCCTNDFFVGAVFSGLSRCLADAQRKGIASKESGIELFRKVASLSGRRRTVATLSQARLIPQHHEGCPRVRTRRSLMQSQRCRNKQCKPLSNFVFLPRPPGYLLKAICLVLLKEASEFHELARKSGAGVLPAWAQWSVQLSCKK